MFLMDGVLTALWTGYSASFPLTDWHRRLSMSFYGFIPAHPNQVASYWVPSLFPLFICCCCCFVLVRHLATRLCGLLSNPPCPVRLGQPHARLMQDNMGPICNSCTGPSACLLEVFMAHTYGSNVGRGCLSCSKQEQQQLDLWARKFPMHWQFTLSG